MNEQELFRFIDAETNCSMESVKQIKDWLQSNTENKMYLYGAGAHLQYVVQFCVKYEIPVRAVLDTFKGDNGSEFLGIPIIKYESFLKSAPASENCSFLISAPSAIDTITLMLRQSFVYSKVFSFETQMYLEFIPNIEDYREYLLAHREEIIRFWDDLEDDYSRQTLENVLKGRISGNIKYYADCAVPDQYYPKDIITFSAHEVMVELGANNGQTLREFIRKCPVYQAVYCFEPETRLLTCLDVIRAEEELKGNKVILVPKGAWDKAEILHFMLDDSLVGSGSFVLDNGGQNCLDIETTTVDITVREPITYLKMDIEGAELRALHGAEKQIRENKPKLAVCVYHKPEDILDIWNYLRSLVPEYRFYIRHHSIDCGTETVLYAI